MTNTWAPGDAVVLRGIYNRRVWYIQSVMVVQDKAEEVALAVLPGAECCAPEGYIHGKHGPSGHWDRWDAYKKGNWKMERYTWHTNRLLILLQPEKYYASYYFWQADKNQFIGYYVNFQLPFRRNKLGFDTLDLELDILVEPTYEWRWKDAEDYQRGIQCGILREEWIQEIEAAKQEVFHRLEKRQYPYDGSWLHWLPDPAWSPSTLPKNWDKI
jgi:hypothetical protein